VHAGIYQSTVAAIRGDRHECQGHEAGDRLVRLVADAVGQSIRPQDFAARIRSDELAATLSPASAQSALELGNRVRQAIVATVELPLTASVGVAPVTGAPPATRHRHRPLLSRGRRAGRCRHRRGERITAFENHVQFGRSG
jgi:GGDEF domain-containing protein